MSSPMFTAKVFLPWGSLAMLSSFTSDHPSLHSLIHCSRISLPRVQSSTRQNKLNVSSDTQEAVSTLLREYGLSSEESDRIAHSSPNYSAMLEEGVSDLDEWSGWSNCESNHDDPKLGIEGLGYKEKVIQMARRKGDGGKLAFLESIGLSLNSSMKVARYLHGQSLPSLIQKVKYMKEKLFSGSDDEALTGKNARRLMMHLSIATDDDIQQTLSLFEKMAAMRGGIDLLGASDASFGYLVESFPQILLLSIDSHLIPLTELFVSLGIPPHHFGRIILLFPPIMMFDVKELNQRLQIFRKACSLDKRLNKLMIYYPWILSTCVQDNYKEILSFFDSKKVPRDKVEEAIAKFPYILGCSKAKLQVMVDQLKELKIKRDTLGKVISSSPRLLIIKPEEFLQVVSFLENLGFEHEDIMKVIVRCPELFTASVEKTLKNKVNFLISIGVSDTHMPRAIKKYPELLVSDVNSMLTRVRFFTDLGISKREVAFMIRRFSPLLGYSVEEVLKPKTEFLVKIMGKSVMEVVDYPRYFSYSLEKKIKPRFWILKEKKIECNLKDMLDKNDEEFAANFFEVDEVLL